MAWVGEKVASGLIKGNAKAKRRDAQAQYSESMGRLEQAQSEHQTQAVAAFQSASQLGVRRTKDARRVLARVVRAAKLTAPRAAFAKQDGWFGGRNERTLLKLIGAVKTLDARIGGAEAAGAALILAAGIEQIEQSLPQAVGKNVQEAIAQGAADQAADWADALGSFGDFGVSDAVSGLSMILSGVSLYASHREADKIRAQARDLLQNAEQLEIDAKRHAVVAGRARDLDSALSGLSYPAFKQAWIAEQIARGPKLKARAAMHAAQLCAFERAVRNFWAAMSAPVVDGAGRADTLPPLELAPA